MTRPPLFHGSNPKASGQIREEIGALLSTPILAQWNSIYDAVACLANIFDDCDRSEGLRRACASLKVPPFSKGECRKLESSPSALRQALIVFERVRRSNLIMTRCYCFCSNRFGSFSDVGSEKCTWSGSIIVSSRSRCQRREPTRTKHIDKTRNAQVNVFQPFAAVEPSANVCVAHWVPCNDPSVYIATNA